MKSNNQNQERPQHGRSDQRHHSGQEGAEHRHELEQEQQQGSDGSYSEQTDVTPPAHHEFPSVGNAKTDFVSRKQGRTTGRMIGHEPGTEG